MLMRNVTVSPCEEAVSQSLSPDLPWASCPDKTRLIFGFVYTGKHAKNKESEMVKH